MQTRIHIGHVATCQFATHIPRVVYFHVIQNQIDTQSFLEMTKIIVSWITLISYKRN